LVQALVPLKDLVQAKTRLAGLLRPSERRALAQAMVEDVLSALSAHPLLERVTLLSDDPGAGMLAHKYGAVFMPESSLGCAGLNRVLAAAAEQLLQDSAQELLVLHGDLPLLATDDIDAVLAQRHSKGGLVIGSDRHGRGSNLLAFGGGTVPPFCFGPDSCQRHQQAASELGIHSSVIQRMGIALDVDEGLDMELLMASLDRAGRHSAALLHNTELGSRIEIALSAMSPAGMRVHKEHMTND
jgi:2-phospho-L-lactate guanylyltransferase